MTDEQLCAIASAYVCEEYARPGERTYHWESSDDPTDDTTARVVGSYAPPDDSSSYSWSEIYSCEVLGAEILERSADGVLVEVKAAIALLTDADANEDADDTEPAAEERLISCWLEQDCNGEWYVENAEE